MCERAIRFCSGVATNTSRFLDQEKGLTLVEYAVAAGLIAAAIAGAMGTLGLTIDSIIQGVIVFA